MACLGFCGQFSTDVPQTSWISVTGVAKSDRFMFVKTTKLDWLNVLKIAAVFVCFLTVSAVSYLSYKGRVCFSPLSFASNEHYALFLASRQLDQSGSSFYVISTVNIVLASGERQGPASQVAHIISDYGLENSDSTASIVVRDEGSKFWWDRLQPSRKLVASGNGEAFNSFFSPCGALILTTR